MLNASKHEAGPKISSPNPLRRIRRAVEDYDFDRLEVEAQQCVELTSTNRPFGLIIKLTQTVNRFAIGHEKSVSLKLATGWVRKNDPDKGSLVNIAVRSARVSGFVLTNSEQKKAEL